MDIVSFLVIVYVILIFVIHNLVWWTMKNYLFDLDCGCVLYIVLYPSYLLVLYLIS